MEVFSLANIKSAKKRIKVIETKTLRNKMVKSKLKTIIKKLEAGEELEDKVVIMEEKGFDATTITQEDIDKYGI